MKRLSPVLALLALSSCARLVTIPPEQVLARNSPDWSVNSEPKRGYVPPAPQPTPSVAPAAAAPTAAAPARAAPRQLVQGLPDPRTRPARVAVLEFRGPTSPNLLMLITDEARSGALAALRGKPFLVLTRESMAAVLKDMGKDARCEEGECEVETARNIGADVVVTGEVFNVDGVYMVTLKLHETSSGSLIATRRAEGASQVELVRSVENATRELFFQ